VVATFAQSSPKRSACIVSTAWRRSPLPVTTTAVRQSPPSAAESIMVSREFWYGTYAPPPSLSALMHDLSASSPRLMFTASRSRTSAS